MGSGLTLHSAIFRKNVVFLTTVFAGAFAFEIIDESLGLEQPGRMSHSHGPPPRLARLMDYQRQWKDIRHKYVENEDEDE
ncbi:MAG: hypothetical protein Q9170_000725 [Blastenia crenularia]